MTEDEITLLQKRVRIAEESIVPSWQDVADRWMKACIEHESTIADLRERLAKAEKGIREVDALICESQGVYGLHLNGDVSPWSELLPPGRFSEWLQDFADALPEKDAELGKEGA